MRTGPSTSLRSGWQKTSYWVVKSDRWLKFLVQALFYVVLPAAIAGSRPLDDAPLIETLMKALPAPAGFLAPYLVLITLWLWVATVLFVYGRMCRTVARERLNWEDWETISLLIRKVVERKRTRIATYVRDNAQNGAFPGGALREITRPEDQITVFSEAIEEAFKVVLSNVHGRDDIFVKCRIVGLDKNGKPNELLARGTRAMSTSIDALAGARSTFQISAETRQAVIVEDIASELEAANPRFAAVPGSDREGSLCCYPFIYEPLNTIPMSICVSSKKAYVFRHEDSRWYDWLIKDEFFGRLDIEYGLSLIKAGEN